MTLPAYAMGRASFPELYERILVAPIFRPWVEDLLDRAGAGRGARVLDLACGTGIVARLARARVGPSGRVVGLDVSAPMMEEAKRHAP
ncbi:MAG TPA: methyltransferase domain-containing protein, partial [Burkholderiales bacterium]|nr:methyltransferase domain-containing protein [Burkholderiales bacterium]